MAEPFENLIGIVTHQQSLYEDLLKLSTRKQQAITRGDTNELDYVVEGEALLLMKLGELENERRVLYENTAKDLQIQPDELTVKNWPCTDPECRKKLGSIQADFLDTLKKIDEVNNVNNRLISIQLDYIRQVIDEASSQGNLNEYDEDGARKTAKVQDPRLVDIRM